MNDLCKLIEALGRELPGAELKTDRPIRSNQVGWLDLEYQGKSIVVEWRPGVGFGVSLLEETDDPTAGLFDGPEEVLEDWSTAKEYILTVLNDSFSAERPRRAALA